LSWVQPVEPPLQLAGVCEADNDARRSIGLAEEAENEHEDARWLESESNCNSDEGTEEADVEEEREEKLEEKSCRCNCGKHAQSRHVEDNSEEEEEDSASEQSTGDDDDDHFSKQDNPLHRNMARITVPRLIIPETSIDDVPWETCSIGHLSDGSSEEAVVMHSSYVYEPLSMREDDQKSDCSEQGWSLKVDTEADQVHTEVWVEDDEAVTLEDDAEEMPLWPAAELVEMHEAVLPADQCNSQQESDERDANGKVERHCREEATLELAIEGETHLFEVFLQTDQCSSQQEERHCKVEATLELAIEPETHLMEADLSADLCSSQQESDERDANREVERHCKEEPTLDLAIEGETHLMEAVIPADLCNSQQESDERDTTGKVERHCMEEATLELAIEGETHLMEAVLPTDQCGSQQESNERDTNGKVERHCKEEVTLELAIEGETRLMEVAMQADPGSCKASDASSQAIEKEENEASEENRAVEDDAAKFAESHTTTTFTLEELTNPLIWRQLDVKPNERETFLTAQTFISVFGMDREAFQKLPRWRRDFLKKQKHLF